MKNNLPYLRLFPGDYLRSTVSVCSIGAQGLWLRIMILLHDSERRGYLTLNGSPMPPRYAAKQCSVTPDEYDALLDELLSVKALSVSGKGTIYSPQMVAEFEKKTGNAKRQANYRERKRQEKEAENEKKRNANVTRNVTPPSRKRNGDNSSSFSDSNSKEKDKTIVLSKKKNGTPVRGEKRGTPLPDDFAVTDEMIDWARENSPDVSVSVTTQKFRNHYKAATGRAALSADWTASWRNYLLKAQEMRDEGYTPPVIRQPEKPPTETETGRDEDAPELLPPEAFVPEPLTDKSRENALVILRGIVRDSSFDSIEALSVNYAPEDWAWLVENLKKSPEAKGES